MKYKGKELWRVAEGTKGIFDGVTTEPYGAFVVKRVRLSIDE
jgi:hypothetical protein